MSTYKQGDKVIYLDVLAIVDAVTESFSGTPMLDLISVDNPEMTCTAVTSECRPFIEDEYDEAANIEALHIAKVESGFTTRMVDKLTDKYIQS